LACNIELLNGHVCPWTWISPNMMDFIRRNWKGNDLRLILTLRFYLRLSSNNTTLRCLNDEQCNTFERFSVSYFMFSVCYLQQHGISSEMGTIPGSSASSARCPCTGDSVHTLYSGTQHLCLVINMEMWIISL